MNVGFRVIYDYKCACDSNCEGGVGGVWISSQSRGWLGIKKGSIKGLLKRQ